jgi:hypothetical protein
MKPLVVGLVLALGAGYEPGVVASSAGASESTATQRSFVLAKETPRERRVARGGPQPMLSAAPFAMKPPAQPGAGVSVPVTNCDDEGAGSLRDAVENIAVSGDTVDMTGLNCSTITLISGAITTTVDDLTILGPGTDMNGVTILAGHNSQIFAHLGSGTLTLEYLTVTNGGKYATGDSSASGGCVFSYGSVYLRDTGVKYCVAQTQGAGTARGGGVYARTGIAAVSSTISGNAVRGDRSPPTGGGLYTPGALSMNYSWVHSNEATQATSQGVVFGSGGGLWVLGDVNILNSTISGNTAAVIAGAYVAGVTASSNLEITNSTICDNYSYASPFGSGLLVNSPIIISNSTITGNVARNSINIISGAGLYLGEYAAATLQSTIVSGNSFYDGTTFLPDDIGHSLYGGALVGGANNLVGHSTLPLSLDTIVTSDPGLGPLTTGNGGPTPTKAPLRDSLAINHGNNVSDKPYDQRGPGFPRVIGPFADIGAVESDVIFSNGFD